MQNRMIWLSGVIGRRRRWFIAAWVAIVLLAIPLAVRQGDNLTAGGFDVPGSQSDRVAKIVEERFADDVHGPSVLLVSSAYAEQVLGDSQRPPPGSQLVEPSAGRSAVERTEAAVAAVKGAEPAEGSGDRAVIALSRVGIATIPLITELPADEQIDLAAALREEVEPGQSHSEVTPYLLGQSAAYAGLTEVTERDLIEAELIGLPVIALVLLAVFGSLAAAALPLTLGVVSVTITGALIYLVSLQMDTSVFVTNMASMLGIGVAVDYSLFVLARYREERRKGLDPDAARGEALASSGLAVVFSGAAVVISLLGLFMIDNEAMRSMALGAVMVVLISVLGAVRLLPALIATLGERVESRRGAGSHESPFWSRWTEAVMNRPWISIIVVSVVLLTLAIPALSIKTGSDPLGEFPPGHDVSAGAEIAMAATGAAADEIRVAATWEASTTRTERAAAQRELISSVRADPQIEHALPPIRDGDVTLFRFAAAPEPGTDESDALTMRLRSEVLPASRAEQSASLVLGGDGTRVYDVRGQISGSMWKLILFVLAFSFVALLLLLRSVILPLKAVLINLLGVGAAYGVLVAVFQWGWLDGFLGFRGTGAIDVINVPLILAVVFGLSMDYQVFLLSRIRERWLLHGDNRRAVSEGLSSSARTISSAALIMTCVFAAFTLTGVPSIKQIGMGAAIAIALDATLVRLILVPAAMRLLGSLNWWMPAWLDRILPDMSFEGGTAGAEPDSNGVEPSPATNRSVISQ